MVGAKPYENMFKEKINYGWNTVCLVLFAIRRQKLDSAQAKDCSVSSINFNKLERSIGDNGPITYRLKIRHDTFF